MSTGQYKFRSPLTERAFELMRSQADEYLVADQYKKALGVYAEAYARCNNEVILENYLRTGNQVRIVADDAYQKKNYLKAGRIYHILLDQRIAGQDSGKSLSFDDVYLKRMIKVCSKCLNEIGLIKYRSDRLDQAVSVWDQILTFDRDNKSIKKAIETANNQLKTIKMIRQD
jgi:tetratricopeptide (TPR) repeat protein